MSFSIDQLHLAMESQADSQKAAGMAAYMRNQFSYLGIPSPVRKEIIKPFLKLYTWTNESDFIDWIHECWSQPYREYKYVALDFSFKFEKKLSPAVIKEYEKLIAIDSWWDTVDGIVPQIIGRIVMRNISLRESLCRKWIESNNIWYQRSAIILQLMYRNQTDFKLLSELILRRADSKEFFVQKASGWALRQYSKINPQEVSQFISENKIPSLAAREGMRLILKSN